MPSEDGVLGPILDTGATHCLLPLKWLEPEQAAKSKRIHLKVASGTSVRVLKSVQLGRPSASLSSLHFVCKCLWTPAMMVLVEPL